MPDQPLVSVLMAVTGKLTHLPQAVESILTQTYRNIEFIIVNDGADECVENYLEGLTDARVYVTHNEKNIGLTKSLNRGLSETRGKYIARMDADDISHKHRLASQVQYLERHPETGLLGTACRNINASGKHLSNEYMPKSSLAVKWCCLVLNPFIHTSVMIRKSILDKHNLTYDPKYIMAQDYELWSRILEVTQGENLPQLLVDYRIHPDSLHSTRKEEQLEFHRKIALRSLHHHFEKETTYDEDHIRLIDVLVHCDKAKSYEPSLIYYLWLYEQFLKKHPGHQDMHSVRSYTARTLFRKAVLQARSLKTAIAIARGVIRTDPSLLLHILPSIKR